MTAARPPTLRRRLDNLSLRWQARLDGEWADRVVPWSAAGVLFAVLWGLALARARSLDAGATLASWQQGAWLISNGDRAFLSIPDTHLLSDQAELAFYPIALLTRVLPAVPTLLAVQSAALAVAVVPLWRLCRDIVALRVGATAAVVAAYALFPAVHNLNLDDFHPGVMAVPALLAALVAVDELRWRRFGVLIAVVLAARSELGVVVVGLGVLLIVEGRRRAGAATAAAGAVWTVVAVSLLQPAFGDGTFVHTDVFSDYGDSAIGIVGGVLTSPVQVVGELVAESSFTVVVSLLAPVIFLPLLAFRKLAPALPLFGLHLVAAVPVDVAAEGGGASVRGSEHTVAMIAFVFVATAYAIGRIGRPSITRRLVDTRVMGLLVLSAVVFFVSSAASSPYERPWSWGGRDGIDRARLEAADAVDADDGVLASAPLLPLLAERHRLFELAPMAEEPKPTIGHRVDVVIIDTSTDESGECAWCGPRLSDLEERLDDDGFEQASDEGGILRYVRSGG